MVYYWLAKHAPENRCAKMTNEMEVVPATVIDTQGGFYFLFMGLFVSSMVLLIERIYRSVTKKHRSMSKGVELTYD